MSLEDIPRTLEFKPATPSAQSALSLIDQRKLPLSLEYVECFNSGQVCDCIKDMAVRGAPAIGIAGAFALVLWAENEWLRKHAQLAQDESATPDFLQELEARAAEISKTRPTAVNLSWALNEMVEYARASAGCAQSGEETCTPAQLEKLLETKACQMAEQDVQVCKKIGEHGASELAKLKNELGRPLRIETHCNAGSLACVHGGTALAVIYEAHAQGLIEKVWVDETRPVEQGARLTAWELEQAGVPYSLICDNMAGSLMKAKQVDAVVVGADRICKNGDFANKIGTYSLAVLARHHRIPFYVAAPKSTFDYSLARGSQIEIEQRDAKEVRCIPHGREWLPIAPQDCDAFNPAFDVTPARLVTAVFTEEPAPESKTAASAKGKTAASAKDKATAGAKDKEAEAKDSNVAEDAGEAQESEEMPSLF